ncbi:MAG: hypothetical protein K2U26_05600 [Cyclobacteriaceae bacterium]|nr:hypothetical protein [Cyclobacteriaceae bacterium]
MVARQQIQGMGVSGDDDMYGSMFGRAGTLDYDYSPQPTVYNKWCNCRVNAFDVLFFDPTNQNKELRALAEQAVKDYFSSEANPEQDATRRQSDARNLKDMTQEAEEKFKLYVVFQKVIFSKMNV